MHVVVSSSILRLWLAIIAIIQTRQLPAAAAATAASSNELLSWTIYHSWNPQQEFVKRGSIIWNKNGNDEAEENNNNKASSGIDDSSSILKVVNHQDMTANDIAAMLDYGWYHVKLVPDSNPDDAILGTVPACHVRRANFKDVFDITLPRSTNQREQQDHILSFAYTPLVSPLAPKSCDEYPALEENTTKSFQSKTQVKLDTPALSLKPVFAGSKPPPGLTFLKRPKDASSANRASSSSTSATGNDAKEELDYEDPEPKPEPPSGLFGFFQRYWYLILPMILMQIMSPPPAEDPQQQQQGQAPGGPTAAAPTTTAGNSGAKQGGRRGKRN
ncbi:hypothetical protein IV203_000215 [Nitzschia inconspicua]|uniref:ER membrane protein complex subunit 10 n=1 Tax=Nitzschia inconspicua TaxID=303405 RepID=A0A9K3PSA2_9STRA|nr:hypothetical protein IV203_000215 [Nitzschia inconspicua]